VGNKIGVGVGDVLHPLAMIISASNTPRTRYLFMSKLLCNTTADSSADSRVTRGNMSDKFYETEIETRKIA
jgi:hypothetical protein